MRKLDVMFAVDDTSTMSAAIQSIAAKLGSQVASHRHVEGTLLPASAAEKHYLWFHIDQNEEDRLAKSFFCHLLFMMQPQRPAPASVVETHEKGLTIEWLIEQLSIGAGKSGVVAIVDAELRTPKPRKKKVIGLEPLQVGQSTLVPSGAEYTSAARTGEGVRGFRWSDKHKGFRSVWLQYDTHWNWSDPWDLERSRCLKYMAKLL